MYVRRVTHESDWRHAGLTGMSQAFQLVRFRMCCRGAWLHARIDGAAHHPTPAMQCNAYGSAAASASTMDAACNGHATARGSSAPDALDASRRSAAAAASVQSRNAERHFGSDRNGSTTDSGSDSNDRGEDEPSGSMSALTPGSAAHKKRKASCAFAPYADSGCHDHTQSTASLVRDLAQGSVGLPAGMCNTLLACFRRAACTLVCCIDSFAFDA